MLILNLNSNLGFTMQNYFSYDKVTFIIDELYNNFSLNEKSFNDKFNVNLLDSADIFYQDKASLIYCDYFFFNIKFNHITTEFQFEKIDSKLLLEGNSFFAIKVLSNQQRKEIEHFTEKERFIYLDKIILEQNIEFVSLLVKFTNNSFNTFLRNGIEFQYKDQFYELISTRKNLLNF